MRQAVTGLFFKQAKGKSRYEPRNHFPQPLVPLTLLNLRPSSIRIKRGTNRVGKGKRNLGR